MKTKSNKILISALLVLTAVGTAFGFHFSLAQSTREINVSAYIVNSENKEITNGEYEVRFALYASDRSVADAYPSNSDARIWEEVQTVKLQDGFLNAYLGAVNPIPGNINFSGNIYYLGIRMGTDSEMVPRKRIGAVPLAIDALSINGSVIGTGAGNIVKLGNGGKIDVGLLPTGTSGKKLVLAQDLPNEHDEITLSGNYDYLTLSGQEITLGQINLNTDVSGNLSIAQGGTGLSSFTKGDLTYYDSGSSFSKISIGAEGQVLTVSGGIPVWENQTGNLNGLGMAGHMTYWTDTDEISYDNNGNFYWDAVNNRLGIGTVIPSKTLDVVGDITFSGDLTPGNANQSIGEMFNRFEYGYFENLDVTNLNIAGVDISGTTSNILTINSDNTTNDVEDSYLAFGRGEDGGVPNSPATIQWNSTSDVFALNFPLNVNGVITATGGTSTNWNDAYTYRLTGVTNNATGLTLSLASNNLTAALTSGYVIPTTTQETNWNTAYTHSGLTSNVHGLTFTAEGSGGGLDADLLDGQHASSFQTALSTSGSLIDLTGSTISVKEGTLTDGRICTYSSTSGLVCTTTTGSVGVNYWTLNGSDLYPNDTAYNVGIGTITPATKLDVNGVITATGGTSTNWNTAYGWGDHSAAGYFVKATDDLDDIVAGTTNVHLTTTLKSNYDSAYTYRITGVTDNATGLDFSLASNNITLGVTSGYVIPTTTQETNWNTAYTNRVDTWNYPLSISSNAVSFGYNTTNLQLTANQLNTIQNINSTATPTFQRLTLGYDGADGTLALYSEQGAIDYSTTFQPGTQTQNITYTLPNNDGDSDQVLTSDGSGVLTWKTVTGIGGAGDITAIGDVASGDAFTSGGTSGTSLYFANSTFHGQLTVGTLTNDRTYTLPNVSGTFITTGDTGTVTSTMIADNTILEVDLVASNTPSDGQVLVYNNSTGGFSWSSAGSGGIGDITAVGDATSGDAFTAAGTSGTSLYFYDADGRGQLTIADLTAARTYTLPDSSGTIALTSDLHSAVTIADTSSIDLSITGQEISGVVLAGGVDHNSLNNLATGDVHTQYALLAGRSGGQTLIGGTGSGDDLTFQTTSNATKGSYIFSELGNGIVLSTSGTLSTITNNSTNWDAGYTYRLTGVTNNATGLTLSLASNNLTAALTSGYVIPTTTQETNWNTAYTHSGLTSNVHGLTFTAEGSGGGLDADLLDGQHGTYYATAASISGTDNYIPRFNGTSALENSIIYDDGTNVGIGTTVPGSKLEIAVGSSGQFKIVGDTFASQMRVNDAGGVYWEFGTAASPSSMFVLSSSGGANNINTTNRDFKFYSSTISSGTSIMTLKESSGYVGIGMTAPGVKLHIYNSGANTEERIETDGGSNVAKLSLKNADRTWSIGVRGDISDGFSIYSESYGASRLFVAGDSNGYVGIGTTAPATALDVNGVITATGGTSTNWNDAYTYRLTGVTNNATGLTLSLASNNLTAALTSGYVIPTTTQETNWNTAYTHSGLTSNVHGLTFTAEGSGGGLDADLLDGQHGTYYATAASISGTDNYIPRFNGTSALENSIIYDDGTNVGIGTTVPGAKLQIASTSEQLRLSYDSSNYTSFSSSNSGSLSITPSGGNLSVQIGTNVGSMAIYNTYSGTIQTLKMTNLQAAGSGVGSSFGFYGTSGSYTMGRIDSQWNGAASTDSFMSFSTRGSNTVNEVMRLTSSSYIGIGTTAPEQKLHVSGQSQFIDTSGYNNRAIIIGRSTTDAAVKSSAITSRHWLNSEEPMTIIGSSIDDASAAVVKIGGGYSNNNAATLIRFYTSSDNITLEGTEKMRITDSGYVGIGTTAPGAKLDVAGTLTVSGSNLTTLGGNLTVTGTAWTATPTISGLITATSGLTSTGTLTANGTFDANGAVTMGDGGDDIAIDSNDWDISSTGAISGITTINMSNQLTSTLVTGTSPFAVSSTTVNTNLNADLLDGQHGTYYATAASISGTDNYIPRFSGTSALENSIIYDDGTNIGIGTINPGALLEIQKSVAGAGITTFLKLDTNTGTDGDGAAIRFITSSDNTSGLQIAGVRDAVGGWGSLRFYTRGSDGEQERVRITNSGNVGIGTTAPGTALDVNGVITATGGTSTNWNTAYSHSQATTNVHGLTFTAEGTGGGLDADLLDGHDTAYFQTALTNPVTGTGTTNYLSKFTGTSTIGSSLIYDNGTNVGIGTTAPKSWAKTEIVTSGTLGLLAGYDAGGGVLIGYAGNTIQGRTGSSQGTNGNLILNPFAGNVGIGTTAPGAKLHVSDGGILLDNAQSLSFVNSAGTILSMMNLNSSNFLSIGVNSGSFAGTTINAGTGSGANIDFILGSSLTAMRIAATNGYVGIGTTSPGAKLDVAGTLTVSGSNLTTLGGNLTVTGTAWTATPTISGLITATSGLTSTGTLTANGTFDANGAVTMGDGGDDIAIDSNDWDISSTGAISGITTINMSNQLTSTLATGTSPFAVTSTTVNTNLNADLLDGQHGTYYATATSISGTDNYIPRFSGTSALENSIIYDNGTNVGIGTTVPGAKLDVAGSTQTQNLKINSGSGQVFTFWKSGTNELMVANDNTTEAYFEIGSNTSSTRAYNGYLRIWGSETGAWTNKLELAQIAGTYGKIQATGNLALQTTSGNVGIGTTSPTYTLTVNGGDIYTSGDLRVAGDDIFMATNTSGYLLIADGTNYNPTAMSGDVTITSGGVTTIGANTVTLSTDTTGNYVATITGGSGIASTGATSGEGIAHTLSLGALTADWSQTGAYDIVLGNASSELQIMESSGDTYYGTFDVGDLSADQTYTFTTGGTVWTSGNDGTGSTLDADLLDGHDTAYFQTALTNPVTGTGTTNYLSKFTGASAVGNSLVYDNGTNVGIGTTVPETILHIAQAGTGPPIFERSGAAADTLYIGQYLLTTKVDNMSNGFGSVMGFQIRDNAGVRNTIATFGAERNGADNSGALVFYTASAGTLSEHLRITSGGNVGIGTTSPGGKLNILATSGSQLRLSYSSSIYADLTVASTGNLTIAPNTAGATTTIGAGTDVAIKVNSSGNVGIGTTSPGSKLGVYGGLAIGTYATVASPGNGLIVSGSVGIGTTNPSELLSVYGDAKAISLDHSTTSSYNQIIFEEAGVAKGYLSYIGTAFGGTRQNTLEFSTTTGDLSFSTNSTSEKMRITNTGNIGIGTTSPNAKLDVRGTANLAIFYNNSTAGYGTVEIGGNGSANASYKLNFSDNVRTVRWQLAGNAVGSTGLEFNEGDATNNRMYIASGGNVGIGTTAPSSKLGVLGNLAVGATYGEIAAPTSSVIVEGSIGIGTTTPNSSLSIVGNMSIGNVAAGSSGTRVLVLNNGVVPTTSPADSVQLYSEDVTSSSELKVRDEAGNVTTLSPHNFSLIPEGRSEDLAWSFYSQRDGEAINVDMTRTIRLVEKLTGQQLIYLKDLESGEYKDVENETETPLALELLADQKLTIDENANSIETLKKSINEQLAVADSRITNLETKVDADEIRISDLETLSTYIKGQMEDIKEQNTAILDFFAVLNPETLVVKDAIGNVDLLKGRLEAEGVVAGAFTIKVVDDEKKTIGEYAICPAMTEVDEEGECTIGQVDDDNDEKDDKTGNLLRDGKSVIVKTKAVSEKSRVFITPKSAASQPLAVTKIEEGKSFTVEIKDPVLEKIDFDWFIVEEKEIEENESED